MFLTCQRAIKCSTFLIGVFASRSITHRDSAKKLYCKQVKGYSSVTLSHIRGGSSSNAEFANYKAEGAHDGVVQNDYGYPPDHSEIKGRVRDWQSQTNAPNDQRNYNDSRDRDYPSPHVDSQYGKHKSYARDDGFCEPELPPDAAYMSHPFSGSNASHESEHSGIEDQRYLLQKQQQQQHYQHSHTRQRPRYSETQTETLEQSPELELESFDKDLIFSGLKRMYRKKIMPLEISSKFGHFHSPPLSPSDFEAKPMVLLLGQYSVGKTSFIKYLLGRDFPGIRIGPEPTTDRFNCIMHGDTDKIIPGAALCSQADRPFRGLSPFGNTFLSRLEGVEVESPILLNITLVDTPGILSGAKPYNQC